MAGSVVYSVGLLCCSACAPKSMSAEEVAADVNSQVFCGTTNGWTISTDETFASGEKIPAPCADDPDRQHWLLDA